MEGASVNPCSCCWEPQSLLCLLQGRDGGGLTKVPTSWALVVLHADQVGRRRFNGFPSISHAAAWSMEPR